MLSWTGSTAGWKFKIAWTALKALVVLKFSETCTARTVPDHSSSLGPMVRVLFGGLNFDRLQAVDGEADEIDTSALAQQKQLIMRSCPPLITCLLYVLARMSPLCPPIRCHYFRGASNIDPVQSRVSTDSDTLVAFVGTPEMTTLERRSDKHMVYREQLAICDKAVGVAELIRVIQISGDTEHLPTIMVSSMLQVTGFAV